MSKPAIRRLSYPMLILLAALLFAGCASERPAAGTDGGNAASPAAAQEAQPQATASPQAGDAATDPPSASAGNAATPSPAAETAAPEGAAIAAAPTAVPATAGSSPAAAGTAPRASSPPGTGAGAATAAASAKPAAASPSAGAKPPAATVSARPAATAAVQPAATPQTVAQATAAAQPAAEAATAVISITGDEEHGVILAASAYEIKEGESALELLKRITRKAKIQMEYQGAKGFAYVEGIDNLYEFDHGAESGWMFKVNGAFPGKGAGSYTVHPGDTIEWLYTLDLGKDLGAKAP